MKNNKKSITKSIGVGLAVVLGLIIFAYAFQVTDVNFETTRSEIRLTQLTRVLRALVKPDVFTYEKEEIIADAAFYLPCPENGSIPELPPVDKTGPYLKANVTCASPKEIVVVEGFNLIPNSSGPINFVTSSGVNKQIGKFSADANGHFVEEVEIPTRQPVAQAQTLRAVSRVSVGTPQFTGTAVATWEKIVETIFIAFLATVLGTLIAIPISFAAARNLMVENTSPLTSVGFSIISWPIGIWIGSIVTRWLLTILASVTASTLLTTVGALISPAIVFFLIRWSIPAEDSEKPTKTMRIFHFVAMLVAAIFGIVTIFLWGALESRVGAFFTETLGPFSYLGNFLFQIGEITTMLTPLFVAICSGAVLANALSKIGQRISDGLNPSTVKMINVFLTALAGATLFTVLGAGVEWFYQIGNPVKTLYWPAGVGAALGILIALLTKAKQALPTGMIIYYITRTLLNGTRSVEPLIMAIVAVIWVGIGPFAGSLALALHTVASLSKLYSEQVESISTGPIEAVRATGANQLQTIIYAVIPQIIPPYISFTMYRWDINVRMSTIIGFVGGGGIGFLLIQNINLLDYRGASVQMLAIAIVVASMDYISSVIRERYV